MADTHYFFPVQWLAFLWSILYFVVVHPILFFRAFATVMLRRGEKFKNRIRTLGHFGGGVYLAYQIKNENVKHIHAHFSVNAATIGLVIANLLELPFSFTVHNNIFTDQLILKRKLKEAKFIVSISEFSRDFLINFAPEQKTLKEKFQIVHCGIAPESFQRQNGHLWTEPPLVFSLSHMAERKGLPVLVEACRILRDRGCQFRCVIGGNGPQSELLHSMVEAYNLHDVVALPGVIYQQKLRDYLERAAMFVLPCVTASNGDVDGIPVVLMEAMAMGVPAISTTVSGIPELIDHEKTGLLVPEKDAEALANAIQRLLENRGYAIQLGIAGRETVNNEFNIHQTAEQLVGLFETYLGA
jgi:glycosyltransferase involved in cell wall biosynthesis